MVFENPREKEEVLVVAVKVQHYEYLLKEIIALIENLNAEVIHTMTMHTDSINSSSYIGKGKIEEVKRVLQELGIKTVVINDNISPGQKKVLENELAVKVLDRTEIILSIFAKRAMTKEAKLQVELAQLQYLMPRLTRMWSHLSRQQGGIGMKGVGETQIEIDRRTIKNKIARLRKDIERVKDYRSLQRKRRLKSQEPIVALVGYTNAGKSSLFNFFSGKDVYAADQLFATLDTITKKVVYNDKPFYIVDTVGFISNLPHFLIDSFKATLEEVFISDLLLQVIDVSDPNHSAHIEAVNEILRELGIDNKPTIKVYNKMDLIKEKPDLIENGIVVSVKTGENMGQLKDRICEQIYHESS
ncbi:MAG: GTPase HflX [Candidatus Margulisbacteria bacterium]|nr:GTPase HflX [Candidatus Margulisiibacteriota bacterium]